MVAPPVVDPTLASDTIRYRTLPKLWDRQGELRVARRLLGDPVKRSHAVGHLAEDDLVARDPVWRKTAAANAPENDVWRWARGRLEGGQIKTHASGNAAAYLRDMLRDGKAEGFFVPDDHMGPLMQRIGQQVGKADGQGSEDAGAIWRAQLARVRPLGRTYGELERGVMASARRSVRRCALRGAGGTAAAVLAVDGVAIWYRCAEGELTPLQSQDAIAEALAKAGLVGGGTYVVVLLGANPMGLTVIVVGAVVYLVADYGFDELRPALTSSPLTHAQVEQVMPVGWRAQGP